MIKDQLILADSVYIISLYIYPYIHTHIHTHTRVYVCVFTLNGQSTGGGEYIYGNGLVPSCHREEEDGDHKQGDHLTSAAPQLRGVKMLLKPLQNLT